MSDLPGFHPALRAFAENSRGRGDWPDPQRAPPLIITPAVAPCRRALYMTKWFQLRGPLGGRPEPDDTMIIQRLTLPLPCHVDLLRRALSGTDAAVYFVGDLDPIDLTVYFTLLHGGFGAAPDARFDVRYLGIDDGWLALCRRYQIPDVPTPPERALFAERTLSPFDRDNLQWLESFAPEWSAHVGPQCAAMLRAGRGIDVEGASAKGLYHRDFYPALWDHLMT